MRETESVEVGITPMLVGDEETRSRAVVSLALVVAGRRESLLVPIFTFRVR